jgi:hypothetical protein
MFGGPVILWRIEILGLFLHESHPKTVLLQTNAVEYTSSI